jgi:Flp pilus assembly protein TadG
LENEFVRLRSARTLRRGATLFEAALVLLIFLVLVLGMIDLGVGVARYNMISHAARQAARQVTVHGSLAPSGWQGGPWGPAGISTSADAAGVPVVTATQPFLFNCDLSRTTIRVDWIDGANGPGKRARVTVTSPYRPILTSVFGDVTLSLGATSTMAIVH